MDKNTSAMYVFISVLRVYDKKLAERLSTNNVGIYTNCKLYEKTNNLSDIVFSNVKNNFGATKEKLSVAFSNKLANNVREVKKGVAVINNKGIYFFVIESKVYNNITNHYFFPLDQLPEIGLTIKMRVYFNECFSFRNIYSDSPNEDYHKHSLTLDREYTFIDKTLVKMDKFETLIQKIDIDKFFFTVVVVLFFCVSFVLISNRWLNPFRYLAYDHTTFRNAVNAPLREHSYYRRTTTLSAHIETGVFVLELSNGGIGYFVGAAVPDSFNIFLLELDADQDITWEINDIVRVRGVSTGSISIDGQNYLRMRVETIELQESIGINDTGNVHINRVTNHQITFTGAYMSEIVTDLDHLGAIYRKRDVLIINYNFMPLSGSASYRNIFRNNFVVYDSNGNILEFWDYNEFIPDDNFLVADRGSGRFFILYHRNRHLVSATNGRSLSSALFLMMIVVPENVPEYIRIVRYGMDNQVVFNYKIYVKTE